MSEHHIISTQYLFLSVSPPTSTQSVSIENITISTYPDKISTPTSPHLTQNEFATAIEELPASFNYKFFKQYKKFKEIIAKQGAEFDEKLKR